MYWLLGSKSQLSTENNLLLYKAILKKSQNNTPIKKKMTSRYMRHWAYALRDLYKLSNVLLNVTKRKVIIPRMK